MSLLIPKSFSTKTGSVQLSDLDTNFTYLTSTVNTALDITGTAVTVYGTLGASGAVTLASTLTVNGGAGGASVLLRNGGDLQLFNADNTGNVSLYCDTHGVLHVNSINVNTINVLTGAVSYFAMNTAPTGWLKANGAEISRTTYSALFSAIGTNFGEGNGSTTFNLPDLRGEFLRAWDDGRGVDSGRSFGSAQAQDWKSFNMDNTRRASNDYTHGPQYMGKTTASYTGNLFTGYWSAPAAAIGYQWDSSEIRPRNVALLACIKY